MILLWGDTFFLLFIYLFKYGLMDLHSIYRLQSTAVIICITVCLHCDDDENRSGWLLFSHVFAIHDHFITGLYTLRKRHNHKMQKREKYRTAVPDWKCVTTECWVQHMFRDQSYRLNILWKKKFVNNW